MPEIIINEIDNTVGSDVTSTNYELVILGALPFKEDYKDLKEFKFDYVNNKVKFEEVVARPETGATYLTPVIVPALCNLGMKVLYVHESGLNSGSEEDIRKALKRFEDKSRYEYRFISIGDYATSSNDKVEIFNKVIGLIATERSDVLALTDLPAGMKAAPSENAEKYFAKVITSIKRESSDKNVGKDIKSGAPWWNYTDEGVSTNVPYSFAYLAAFAYHIKTYKEWYAMSGALRGTLPFDSASFYPLVDYGDADIAVLQRRTPKDSNVTVGVNVLCNINPYGDIIWGNRTLLPLESTDLRASHFLNIRHLCITLKQLLYRVCRKLTFEPNSDLLWTEFCDLIRPTLEEMKTNQGIAGYKITKKKSSKKAQLVATIKIVPIEAVEDFELTVELADSIDVGEGE